MDEALLSIAGTQNRMGKKSKTTSAYPVLFDYYFPDEHIKRILSLYSVQYFIGINCTEPFRAFG